MKMRAGFPILALVVASFGCATTTTTSTTWVDPNAGASWARQGRVESVQEVVQRVQGNPAAGALAGALIGGLLFRGHGPASLFGAAGGGGRRRGGEPGRYGDADLPGAGSLRRR